MPRHSSIQNHHHTHPVPGPRPPHPPPPISTQNLNLQANQHPRPNPDFAAYGYIPPPDPYSVESQLAAVIYNPFPPQRPKMRTSQHNGPIGSYPHQFSTHEFTFSVPNVPFTSFEPQTQQPQQPQQPIHPTTHTFHQQSPLRQASYASDRSQVFSSPPSLDVPADQPQYPVNGQLYQSPPHLMSSPASTYDIPPSEHYYSDVSHSDATQAGSDYIPVGNLKRRKKDQTIDDEDDDDDAVEGAAPQAPGGRLGACVNCKRLKVRCERPYPGAKCRKCQGSGQECTIPGRKPRKAPAKRGDLIEQIRERDGLIRDKDALIAQLLTQFEAKSSILSLSLPSAPSPAPSGAASAPSPSAQRPPNPDNEAREREIQDWIERAKATLRNTQNASTGLLGGDFNPVPEDHSDDGDDGTEGTFRDGDLDDESERDDVERRNEKVNVLPSAAPLGFIADMSLQKKRTRRGSSVGVQEADEVGPANESFFRPIVNPTLRWDSDQQNPPEIMTRGLVNPKEVKEFFDIYFEKMNISVSLIDPAIYTPEKTFWRSPFLFTVICAIASRYNPQRHDLYRTLMTHAQLSAGGTLISGKKCVESVQAYILMALYPIPARRWSQDRSWMYLGCAIRMATDLNLHHPPSMSSGQTATTHASIDAKQDEQHAREVLNRTRAWLTCYNLDKSTGMQLGKPLTIREDWVAPLLEANIQRLGDDWWCGTPYGFKYDLHICAYNALLRVIARFHQTIYSDPLGGVNKALNLETVTQQFEDEIEALGEKWFNHIWKLTPKEDQQLMFRLGLLKLEYAYNRLVALSFGFQYAFKETIPQKENAFLSRCYKAATKVLTVIVEELAPQEYLRYGPESQSIFATFASAFLLKLLRPKYSNWLQPQQKTEIHELVGKLIEALNSIAIDDRHAPKLYARFLDGLLQKAKKTPSRASSVNAASPASSSALEHATSVSPNASTAVLYDTARTVTIPATSPTQLSSATTQQHLSPTYGLDASVHMTQPQHTSTTQDYSHSFGMGDFTDTLPSHDPIYGFINPGENITLAAMEPMTNDGYWDGNIMFPGFSFNEGTAHQGGLGHDLNMTVDNQHLSNEMLSSLNGTGNPPLETQVWM